MDRIIVNDNESTDNSVKLLKAHPKVQVRTFKTKGMYVGNMLDYLRNTVWKETRHKQVKWVIICDMDEFLYHPDGLDRFLENHKDFSLIDSKGYAMVHKSFPKTVGQITDEVKYGVESPQMSKTCIFNPYKIKEINYASGAHSCNPTGEVKRTDGLLLLHMRHLGLPFDLKRNKTRSGRYSPKNGGVEGSHCLNDTIFYRNNFIGYLKAKKKII